MGIISGEAGNPPRGFDRVITAGSLLISASLILYPFVVFRETRISPPQGIGTVDATGFLPLAVILSLALMALFLAGRGPARRRNIASATLSRILFLTILWQAGASATRLSVPDMPFARVSIGSGAWLALLGSFMIMSPCRRAAREERLFVFLCWGFYAALAFLVFSGGMDQLSFMTEYYNRSGRFIQELTRHIALSSSAVSAGLLIGFPLGLAALRNKRLGGAIISLANTLQTIPSLALFGLLIAPLAWVARSFPSLASIGVGGIGWAPAFLALTIYSLLPIIKNTISAFSIIDPSIVDAGFGMGMSKKQLFVRVELPLALPVVITGLRISGVQAIGNTAVAALIGAGGLGQFIFQGLGEAAPDLILLGAIPTVMLAFTADWGFRKIASILVPGENR
jgi:osmoprotectant transport system permease protein